jgi:hypothetical protein
MAERRDSEEAKAAELLATHQALAILDQIVADIGSLKSGLEGKPERAVDLGFFLVLACSDIFGLRSIRFRDRFSERTFQLEGEALKTALGVTRLRSAERNKPGRYFVLAATRSDSRWLSSGRVLLSDVAQAAIIFSFVIGSASRKVCIGVLPKHQRP